MDKLKKKEKSKKKRKIKKKKGDNMKENYCCDKFSEYISFDYNIERFFIQFPSKEEYDETINETIFFCPYCGKELKQFILFKIQEHKEKLEREEQKKKQKLIDKKEENIKIILDYLTKKEKEIQQLNKNKLYIFQAEIGYSARYHATKTKKGNFTSFYLAKDFFLEELKNYHVYDERECYNNINTYNISVIEIKN